MASTTPSLKIHQTLSISPPQQTTQKSFPFTFFDTLWLRFPPVERLFFYEFTNSTTYFFESVVPNLKNSLSLTLQHFLPLVGNIVWSEDSPYPTIDYVPGDSIPFIVAESNVDFNKLCSNLCDVSLRHLLIPTLKTSHEKASILSLQVTYFPNHGFCIGITTHHAAVDGKSSTMFLKAWAYICTTLFNNHTPFSSLPENVTPFFDRAMIKDPSGISDAYAKTWLNFGGETNNRSLKVWESISTIQNDAVKGLFELTPLDIQKLKRYAQSTLEKNKNSLRLSSFSVTCAYLLSCAVKVDQLKKVEEPKFNKVAFIFSIDCRQRLDPPIKETYFGNCVVSQLVVFETKTLLNDDGFVSALEGIIDELNGTLENGVLNGAENWMSKIQSVIGDSDKLFSIAGSPRFEVYGVDFGWGKPKKVDVTSIDKTGAFSLSESKNIDGGIEVGLALNKEEMEVFAQIFAQGLESL